MGETLPIPYNPKDFGPRMRALNEREQRFAIAWYQTGGKQERAYIAAGYSASNHNVISANASRLANRPSVIEAIKEYAHTRMGQLVPLALSASEEILLDPSHKDRAKIAMAVMDRTGLHATTEHKVSVEHTDSREEKLRRLAALALARGEDPRAALANLADVVDADFQVIEDKAGVEGLEDVL